jgi:hypothetical protein
MARCYKDIVSIKCEIKIISNVCIRKQKVINRATSSTVCEVSAGVPQGSVLDPLLFLIYINDIGEKLLSLSRLFADDTSLGYSSQNVGKLWKSHRIKNN